ncbi:MAG TPA: NUDIX hydrolase [Solirubrobacterales bacterium]|jgi:ADP-ribose pyrophosphatase
MELLDSEVLFEGHSLDLTRKTYRREDGTVVVREVAEHPGSVAIVAHDEEFVYLVAQPREAVEDDRLLEIPAGTLDVAAETPLDCAQRELAEEAELRAEHWRELQAVYTSPGVLSEQVWIFAATGLSPASGERDADEQIEVVRLPLGEIEATLPGLRDATTVIGLLLLLRDLG